MQAKASQVLLSCYLEVGCVCGAILCHWRFCAKSSQRKPKQAKCRCHFASSRWGVGDFVPWQSLCGVRCGVFWCDVVNLYGLVVVCVDLFSS